MFDERSVVEPKKFRPDRPNHEYMLFGYGLHWCIGVFLAGAQITLLAASAVPGRAPSVDGQRGGAPRPASVACPEQTPTGIPEVVR
jgi:hypothetical protein